MALVDEQMATLNPTQGPRQGQADYVLYPLAAAQEANTALTGQCNGSNTTTLPNITSCVFNDVTVGDNRYRASLITDWLALITRLELGMTWLLVWDR